MDGGTPTRSSEVLPKKTPFLIIHKPFTVFRPLRSFPHPTNDAKHSMP